MALQPMGTANYVGCSEVEIEIEAIAMVHFQSQLHELETQLSSVVRRS